MGVAATNGGIRRIHHRGRRGEVRFADIDGDDRAALARKFVGLARDFHRVERFDIVHARSDRQREGGEGGGVHGEVRRVKAR